MTIMVNVTGRIFQAFGWQQKYFRKGVEDRYRVAVCLKE